MSYFRNALPTERSVNSSDSRGTLSTNGRTAQPSPRGIDRVSDTDSICISNPPSRSSKLQYVFIRHRNPCSSPGPSTRSLLVPGESISAIRVLRETL